MIASPVERYQQRIHEGWQLDAEQQDIVNHVLQVLWDAWKERLGHKKRWNTWLSQRVVPKRLAPAPARLRCSEVYAQGLYVWGPVGRGKTQLLQLLFDAVPGTSKQACHFHALMVRVHAQLKLYQGGIDPMKWVARHLAQEAQLWWIDEFMVHDIADAMILSRLLSGLWELGVCVLMSSNVAPDDLYANGLQRPLFLPTIALIHSHLTVLELQGTRDYRHLQERAYQAYFYPVTPDTHTQLLTYLKAHRPGEWQTQQHITSDGREIRYEYYAPSEGMIVFDFKAACAPPRCYRDYVEWAKRFKTIALLHVPVFTTAHDNSVRNFIHLVDACYKSKVALVLQAQAPLSALYPQGRFTTEFQRTQSRIHEMQQWRHSEIDK